MIIHCCIGQPIGNWLGSDYSSFKTLHEKTNLYDYLSKNTLIKEVFIKNPYSKNSPYNGSYSIKTKKSLKFGNTIYYVTLIPINNLIKPIMIVVKSKTSVKVGSDYSYDYWESNLRFHYIYSTKNIN